MVESGQTLVQDVVWWYSGALWGRQYEPGCSQLAEGEGIGGIWK